MICFTIRQSRRQFPLCAILSNHALVVQSIAAWRTTFRHTHLLLVTALITVLWNPSCANADLVWPAAVLVGRMLSWWAIVIGLVVEYLFIRYFTNLPISRAVTVAFVINMVSALAGSFLIPLLGIAWEFVPGQLLYKVFHIGTFNPLTWLFTVAMAAVVNTVIEMKVMLRLEPSLAGYRLFWWLFVANAISVALCMASFLVEPMSF